MTKENILRIEDELYGGYSTVHNPVSDYWNIELCLYNDPNSSYIFMVRFTSKLPLELPDGQIITQSKLIREVDFEDKERTIRKELRTIGMINDIIFRGIKDYIDYLKLNKQYTYYSEISTPEGLNENGQQHIQHESIDCYEVLQQEIVDNPIFFPHSITDFEVGESEGLFISDYKDKGYPAIAIEGDKLQDIINVVGKAEFEDVIRVWRDKGLLLSGDSKDHRLTSKVTFCTKYRANAYIIKLDKKLNDKMVSTT